MMKEFEDWGDVESEDKYDVAGNAWCQCPASFRVLAQSDIEARRDHLISTVSDSLSVHQDHAESLLCSYRWGSARLLNDCLENADLLTDQPTDRHDHDPAGVPCGTAYCGRHPKSETAALSCNHRFCNDCWRSLARAAISSGRVAVYTQCPGICYEAGSGAMTKCRLKIPVNFFVRFLSEPDRGRYQKWLIDEFVDGMANLKWCIRPSCENAISCSNPNEVVTCHCRMTFCFGCSIPDHRPVPCDLARKWIARANSDSETDKWIKSRTKPCPKCHIPIEKNRACNHMTCSNCSHNFCWLCKQPWAHHDVERYGFYRCNVYEDKEQEFDAAPENVQAALANQELQKFTFYLNRHQHQVQAEREIINLKTHVEEQPPEWKLGLDRVVPALDHLIQARRFLAWSYCLAYYLGAGPYKRLVEHQQGVLESIAEKLQSTLTMSASKPSRQRRRKQELIPPQASESEVVRLGAAVHRFSSELLCELSADSINALSEADEFMDRWACTICTSELSDDDGYCHVCGACRKHSEQECRVPNCKNPRTPEVLGPGQMMAMLTRPGRIH